MYSTLESVQNINYLPFEYALKNKKTWSAFEVMMV